MPQVVLSGSAEQRDDEDFAQLTALKLMLMNQCKARIPPSEFELSARASTGILTVAEGT